MNGQKQLVFSHQALYVTAYVSKSEGQTLVRQTSKSFEDLSANGQQRADAYNTYTCCVLSESMFG